jgi:threonine synthase
MLKMKNEGVLNDGDTVVCTLTGHGLKDPDTAMSSSPQPIKVPADKRKILEVVGF